MPRISGSHQILSRSARQDFLTLLFCIVLTAVDGCYSLHGLREDNVPPQGSGFY